VLTLSVVIQDNRRISGKEKNKTFLSVKSIFKENWEEYLRTHTVREIEQIEVEKMLSCKDESRGGFWYYCKTCKEYQFVKSITAIELFKRYPEIKKQLYRGEFWSDGGYVGTVGEGTNGDIIRNYIKQQGRKGDQLKLINFL